MKPTPSQQHTQFGKELAELEMRLSKHIGPHIFDYAAILSPESRLEVNLDSLNATQVKLLEEYNTTTEHILQELHIELDNIHEPRQDFLEYSRALYRLRYLQALQDFASYTLLKVETRLERKYLETFPQVSAPAETIAIDCPGGFVSDEWGMLDIAKTIELEQKSHSIAARLSSVSEFGRIDGLIREIHAHITVYGMFGYMYEDELSAHNVATAEYILATMLRAIYAYVSRGYTPIQAEANVKDYYANLAKAGQMNTEFGAIIKHVVDTTQKFVLEKTQNKEMAQVIAKEYEDVIAGMFIDELFRVTNYYKLNFRHGSKLDEYEAEHYQCLIDMMLLTDRGKPSDFPMETYSIELSIPSRDLIFQTVTQGIVNPNYTFSDYMSYQ